MKSDLSNNLQEMLGRVVKRLVDNPDEVELSEKEGSNSLVIVVSTAKEDVGKVIGSKGRNITAVRTLASSVAGKHGKSVYVEIKEPQLFRGRVT